MRLRKRSSTARSQPKSSPLAVDGGSRLGQGLDPTGDPLDRDLLPAGLLLGIAWSATALDEAGRLRGVLRIGQDEGSRGCVRQR